MKEDTAPFMALVVLVLCFITQFKTVISDYIGSCKTVAGPVGLFSEASEDYLDCIASIEDTPDSCNRMRQEECLIFADIKYRQPGVMSAQSCADVCSHSHVGLSFKFWKWTGSPENMCDCFEMVRDEDVVCGVLAGPPSPSVDICVNKQRDIL